MTKKLAIIDSDSLFYQSSSEALIDSIQKFDEKFQNILDKTQCDFYVGFYTSGKTFRNEINPEYKANRTQAPPKYMKAIKEYAIAEYNLQKMDGVEADDLCAYWMNQDLYYGMWSYSGPNGDLEYGISNNSNQFVTLENNKNLEKVEKILSAIDKDLLNSIPGKHFNYNYYLEDKNVLESLVKGKWIETSKYDASVFLKSQMVIGDSADGIIGLKGKGKAYWEKIIEIEGVPDWYEFLGTYIEYYKGDISTSIYEFQKNYRCLYMLENDSDFIREVDKTPSLPEFTEIKKDNLNEW